MPGRTSILTGPPIGQRFRFLLRLHNDRRAGVLQGFGDRSVNLRSPRPELVLRDCRHGHQDEATVRKNLQLYRVSRLEVRILGNRRSAFSNRRAAASYCPPYPKKDIPIMGNKAIPDLGAYGVREFQGVVNACRAKFVVGDGTMSVPLPREFSGWSLS